MAARLRLVFGDRADFATANKNAISCCLLTDNEEGDHARRASCAASAVADLEESAADPKPDATLPRCCLNSSYHHRQPLPRSHDISRFRVRCKALGGAVHSLTHPRATDIESSSHRLQVATGAFSAGKCITRFRYRFRIRRRATQTTSRLGSLRHRGARPPGTLGVLHFNVVTLLMAAGRSDLYFWCTPGVDLRRHREVVLQAGHRGLKYLKYCTSPWESVDLSQGH